MHARSCLCFGPLYGKTYQHINKTSIERDSIRTHDFVSQFIAPEKTMEVETKLLALALGNTSAGLTEVLAPTAYWPINISKK